ncbi:hypothetical protein O3G_MSEX001234 [Manduca sexta]|uniref:Aldose 1-epimerase n=1 Tax=Manduca sexta TaxID=7130 RepID=A0A921YJE0_MANSE|nr:hypothetical protein O3G_MSEX001234 [Manduca sexta]KAG6440263.1 hypothetical protein O3G_MSEX001234 [Manduca sexta]
MVTLIKEEIGTHNNETVWKYTWRTLSGFSLSAITYGAIVQSIKVPDKNGITADVVLGFDDLQGYQTRNTPYLGAAVGRCANRIGGAKFTIDDVHYTLAKNVGQDHLHGGIVGFDKANWKSVIDGTKVIFSHFSKDGDEGYPGDLVINITYEVKDDDTFHVEFQSTTTKKTVVNMTNHSYFNLAGHEYGAQELYNHVFVINADKITETTSESIPTGRFLEVGGTPFDFRAAKKLGDVINRADNLFDDNFCVSTYGNKGLNFVSRVVHPSSGRFLEVYSDQPGVQFYTSNFLPSPSEAALVGKDGVGYRKHGAFCLETQNFPDAVHHTNFPRAVLYPGEVYKHSVVYKFGAEKSHEPVVFVS